MWLHCSSFQFHQACFSLIIDCYHLSLIHRIDLQDIALLIYNSVKFPNLTVGTVVDVSVAISFYYFFFTLLDLALASDLSLLLIMSHVLTSWLAMALEEMMGMSLILAFFSSCLLLAVLTLFVVSPASFEAEKFYLCRKISPYV